MMNVRSWIGIVSVLCFGVFVLTSAPALADKEDQERAREAVLKGEIVPLNKALDVVMKEFGGEVVEVELEDEHGGFIYEFKLLQHGGKVLEVQLDAKTLKVLDVED